ncbi:molybdate ABC transporter substrate-binding protein [Chitinibacter sp. S2-10]|uniref:molybdate ABC transporter substrate-binding protein n=1 Tax=Chitinibacter sp. S2-10 TaxID=3373597 RepID=UPI0039776CFF
MWRWIGLALSISLSISCVSAAERTVQVAVASNFVQPMQALASGFSTQTGYQLQVSSGATGKLFAQISHGAPFEVLLAADDEAPAKLVENGLAVKNTRFTYATGALVLWSAQSNTLNENTLKNQSFNKLAIANPKVAPYGRAALEVLNAQGLTAVLTPKLVYGENIAQAQQFVATGNAELGLIAASLVMFDGQFKTGSGWLVPGSLHQPIRQDAVLLNKGQHNPAATAFLRYLQSPAARQLIRRYGYQ